MATYNIVERLYMNRTHADVVFVVDDEKIPGHRAIISEACPHFEKLLYGHFKESNSEEVEINETSPKAFKELIRFVYKGQLEVLDWPTEDLLTLLALAHRYDFQQLFNTVVGMLKIKPLDIDSWSLINDAAALYDLNALKERCTSFAEAKIDDFLVQTDLEKFTPDFIRSIFDSPKIATSNQDKLLGALLIWKNGQRSAEIMSIFQRICWEKVSPEVTAVIMKEFFSKLHNPEEYLFWTQGVPVSKEPSKRVATVDSVLLKKGRQQEFWLTDKERLICHLYSDCLLLRFEKNHKSVDIPMKGFEFEALPKFNIQEIEGLPSTIGNVKDMTACAPIKRSGWFKYNAVFPHATPVKYLLISSHCFKNINQLRFRKPAIYS